jgi:maltooligosyltrehalose synthase
VKQAVIRRALALRREAPDLFARGEYRPLEVTGRLSAHVVAFARSRWEAHCLVVVPRHPYHAPAMDTVAIHRTVWRDTMLHLPEDLVGRPMRDRISDTRLELRGRDLPVEMILSRFPVALLATQ